MSWGGKREGAGRKPIDNEERKIYTVRVSQAEREAIKDFLDRMRAGGIILNKVKSGEVKTALINLIEDFRCVNADDMKSAVLAARMRQIKNSEEEMNGMCKEVEKYAEKKAIQAKTEGKIEEIKRLINAGITTLAIIKESGLYTPEELDAISAP